MNPLNKFLTESKLDGIRESAASWNEAYLRDANDYWVYAFQPIVFDKGGITAAAIVQGRLFMSRHILVLNTINPNKNEPMIEVARLELPMIMIKEVKGNFLSKIQKRDYKLEISNGSEKMNIILIDLHKNYTHSKEKTREFMNDVLEMQSGKQVIKDWHKPYLT